MKELTGGVWESFHSVTNVLVSIFTSDEFYRFQKVPFSLVVALPPSETDIFERDQSPSYPSESKRSLRDTLTPFD